MTASQRNMKVAVLGCGRWGPNHIRVFSSLAGCEVSAVADTDPAQLKRMAEMFRDVNCVADYRQILADPQIDAVVIVTPTSTHHQIVREAILAGKHVFCEKPLCETTEQALELSDLARANGKVLFVGHVFLFNAGLLKVKELIDQGELGAIQYLSSSRTNLGPIRKDVNVAVDLASHDISIFNWLLDSEPEIVTATGAVFLQPGVEDVAFISLRYPKNVLAGIQVSWLDPKKVRQITIVGSKRMATWDDLELMTPVAVYEKGAYATSSDYGDFLHISYWDGDVKLPKIEAHEPLKSQDDYFLKAIREKLVTNRSDGPFGAGVVRVLEAVSRSLEQAGAPVRVNGSVPSKATTSVA